MTVPSGLAAAAAQAASVSGQVTRNAAAAHTHVPCGGSSLPSPIRPLAFTLHLDRCSRDRDQGLCLGFLPWLP